jgi:hypothetical protein
MDGSFPSFLKNIGGTSSPFEKQAPAVGEQLTKGLDFQFSTKRPMFDA